MARTREPGGPAGWAGAPEEGAHPRPAAPDPCAALDRRAPGSSGTHDAFPLGGLGRPGDAHRQGEATVDRLALPRRPVLSGTDLAPRVVHPPRTPALGRRVGHRAPRQPGRRTQLSEVQRSGPPARGWHRSDGSPGWEPPAAQDADGARSQPSQHFATGHARPTIRTVAACGQLSGTSSGTLAGTSPDPAAGTLSGIASGTAAGTLAASSTCSVP